MAGVKASINAASFLANVDQDFAIENSTFLSIQEQTNLRLQSD